MNYFIYILQLMILFIFQLLYYEKFSNIIYILIGNSFTDYYDLPVNPIICKYINIIYKCIFINKKNAKYDAVIYNGNRKIPNNSAFNGYNIIMTTEKLSQVPFMKDIGNGKNEKYQLAIDYRLFNNKWHISYPIFSTYNLNEYLHNTKINYGNISFFMKRKNIVYIQKVHYTNRRFIVKEMMKYLLIDSYGDDLNNKHWPDKISRKNKIDLLKEYKFCIAIENSVITWKAGEKYEAPEINDDYVTEKLADSLLAGCIPIYFGPKNVKLFLPHPDSIINFSNFQSIKSLTDYLILIMNNSSLLYVHLQWHYNISHSWYDRFKSKYSFNYCKVCNKAKSKK